MTEKEIREYTYHSTKSDSDNFHLCRNCPVGNNIEREYRAGGKGDKRKLCVKCRELIDDKNKVCERETEQSVVNREKALDKFKEMQKRNRNLK